MGDVANIPDAATAGTTLPQLGSVAQQSGKWAAQNILRELHGKSPEPFVYKDKGIMAMIGRNAAVAEVGKHRHQVEGPIAFAAWLGVHAMLLSGVHSKTDAFLELGLGLLRPRPRRHRRGLGNAATAGLGRPRRGRSAHRPGPTRRPGPPAPQAT